MPENLPDPKLVPDDELISDEIRDIISHQPHWIIRRGIMLMALVVGSLLILSWFVQYPDVTKAPLYLVAVNSPKKVVSRTEGKLEKLLVNTGALVKKNQTLAFLQSTGNHQEVLNMRNWVIQTELNIQNNQLGTLANTPLPGWNSLGELQQAYVEFEPLYQETLQILGHGFYLQKMQALNQDLAYLSEQDKTLQRQKELLRQDYELQKTELKAQEKLVSGKAMAPLELGQAKSKLIGKASAIEQLEAQMLNQKGARLNKQKEILELNKQISDQRNRFTSALFQFKSKIDEWVNRYVVLAPEQGRLQFISSLQQNQNIQNGQELFFIAPENSSFYGEIIAGQTGIGKIEEKQQVIIRLDSYPSSEFGYIYGIVEYVSPFPLRDSSFVIRIALPKGMKTSYGKIIPYKNNLKAEAEIITKNRRLFERFTSQLSEIIRR
ncbi:MAG: HlyD family efflux transporter periplasmic adaptor subunit [Daejeonella sp.]